MNTDERSKKNSLFHVLLHSAGIREHKEAILEPFGVESVTELQEKDLDTLIARLTNIPLSRKAETPKAIRSLRSKVILVAEEYLDCKIASPESWTRFNALMMNNRIAGKLMWEMDESELKTVNKKLQKLARDMASRRRFEKFQAKHN